MILVIDVGNTNTTLGVFENETLKKHWRITTEKNRTTDELGITVINLFQFAKYRLEDVEGIIISSVVPPVMHTVENMCRRYFEIEPIVVGPGIKTGLNLKVDNPKEIGADRIVNCVAALAEYGNPVIVVDFGTATTFCYVDEKGMYLGGAIAPGIMISTEALYTRAAKLPRVEIQAKQSVIGKTTVSSMQAGIYYGFIGQFEGIVQAMKAEVASNPVVVATGGLARLISADSKQVDVVDPFLTLKGLAQLYKQNKGDF